jgi:translation elongation factor P/translation initiation factor 5A
MIPASQLRTGMAIHFEGRPWKVLAAGYRPGQEVMPGVSHAAC